MLTKTEFAKKIDDLYAAFSRKCATATSDAIYGMLGGDESECTDVFLEDAMNRLKNRRRLPENVGLAVCELWAEWKAARAMGSASGSQKKNPAPCRHCGGKGWITVYCTSRPGVAPAMVRCTCNEDPKLQSQPAHTRETASRIPGAALADPWAVPGARDKWLATHNVPHPEAPVPVDGGSGHPDGGAMDGSPLTQGNPL